MTPSTSMIVLDSLTQYLKYEVTPPKSLKFYDKYLAKIAKRQQLKHNLLDSQMYFVMSLWKRRIDWWQTDYVCHNPELDADVLHHFDYYDEQAKVLYQELNVMLQEYPRYIFFSVRIYIYFVEKKWCQK